MTTVKQNVNQLVVSAEKFSQTGGVIAAAIKRIHMDDIKRVENEIRLSKQTDDYLVSLRKHLTHASPSVRERVAYIVGELMLISPNSKEIDLCIKQLILCAKDPIYFEPINTTGREFVNALGKSGRSEVEKAILPLLNAPSTKSIRQNILVALGKTGGEQTVRMLSELIKFHKLNTTDQIHVLWALGRLGSVQKKYRTDTPLPRSTFEEALQVIIKLVDGPVVHPTSHYCAVYAIGEICDQRDLSLLADQIHHLTLSKAESVIAHINDRYGEIKKSISRNSKFQAKAELHVYNLIELCNKVALSMIRGQVLSTEGERILFSVRILFDAIPSPDEDRELPDVLNSFEQQQYDMSATNQYQATGETTVEANDMSHDVAEVSLVKENLSNSFTSRQTDHIQQNDDLQIIEAIPDRKYSTTTEGADKNVFVEDVDEDSLPFSREDIQEEIEHKMTLYRECRKRLHVLELEKARKGIDTPPQTLTQIKEIKKDLEQIEQDIKRLNKQLRQLIG